MPKRRKRPGFVDVVQQHMRPLGGRCWVFHALPKALRLEVDACLKDSNFTATAVARALVQKGYVAATPDKVRHHRTEHVLKNRPCP